MEVVLIPRRIQRAVRFTRSFFKTAWAFWSKLALRRPIGPQREDFISVFGPMSMVLLFCIWGLSLISGFACVQWAIQGLQPPTRSTSFLSDLFLSGDAFFTLGYSDIVPKTSFARLLIILEAGTGFGFIALGVSYLPVLYGHFSTRDMHLVQLGVRGGSPATAEALLRWYSWNGGLPALNIWLRSWEVWATEIIESHSSYPMLAFYRSQHNNQSWIASTGVVLDVTTLLVTCLGEERGDNVVASFRTALRLLREVCLSLGIDVRDSPTVERLPPSLLDLMQHRLKASGFSLIEGSLPDADMMALRKAYEPMLIAVSDYLLLPLPPWAEDYSRPQPSPDRRPIEAMLDS